MGTFNKIETVSSTYGVAFSSIPNRAIGYTDLQSGSGSTFDTFVAAPIVTRTYITAVATIAIEMSAR